MSEKEAAPWKIKNLQVHDHHSENSKLELKRAFIASKVRQKLEEAEKVEVKKHPQQEHLWKREKESFAPTYDVDPQHVPDGMKDWTGFQFNRFTVRGYWGKYNRKVRGKIRIDDFWMLDCSCGQSKFSQKVTTSVLENAALNRLSGWKGCSKCTNLRTNRLLQNRVVKKNGKIKMARFCF